MIEKDNIQELFSKAFENQTATVRPELWAGVQAKMAAAGVASTSAVATKGLSALTKWIIGSAAVGTVGVVATVIALNSGEKSLNQKEQTTQKETVKVSAKEETASDGNTLQMDESVNRTNSEVLNSGNIQTPKLVNAGRENSVIDDMKYGEEIIASEHIAERPIDKKIEEQPINKIPETKKSASAESGSETTPVNKVVENTEKHPEDTKEPVFVKLEAKVTEFPNIFSPDGNKINDIYFVKAENINEFQLLIIDQNNREMFRSTIPGEQGGWNGRDKSGDEAPSGSYAAIVTGKDQNGKSFRDIQLFELRR